MIDVRLSKTAGSIHCIYEIQVKQHEGSEILILFKCIVISNEASYIHILYVLIFGLMLLNII